MKTKRKVDFDDVSHFTPKQKEASRLVKEHKYTLYGGAMAGGKSYFLRWKLIRILLANHARGINNSVVGLFCEDYPALEDRHISKLKTEFPTWLGDYKSSEHNFVLKPRWGGGTIAFRNLDDASKYQSAEFAAIAVDELTKITEDDFTMLRTRLRWKGIDEPRFIGATNPGGKGHLWVKRLWIDRVFIDNEQERNQFVYIQAKASDNPHIPESYRKTLESLPPEKRRAYLEGDWDIFQGQYFSEWSKEKHVVEPFEIPASWKRFRSIDISGRNNYTSCHWYALDYNGDVWVYREHYVRGWDSDQHADQIRKLSENDHGVSEEYHYTVIDSSAFSKLGYAETMAEIYQRHGINGLIPSTKERLTGWDIVHQYLRWDTNTKPKLKIFNTCTNMIRTIPSLVYDPNNMQDLDTNGEDHSADDLRYFLHTLRAQKTPVPMNAVQKRLQWLKEQDDSPFDYSYA